MKHVARMVELDCTTVSEAGKEQARRAFADTVGVCFPGLREPVYGIVLQYCARRGRGAVPVPGLEQPLDMQTAALAWGALAHAIDFDDSCPKLCGHPSVVLLPAVLATAYQYRKTGKQALEAYICGYEATNRVAECASVEQYDKGWHNTTTIGIFGAVVAVCRLLALDIPTTQHALGLAASMASGLQANFGTMTKPLHPGFTAANAIFSAEMAALGITSSPDAFAGPYSYFALYGGAPKETPDSYRYIEDGIIIKPYPSCGCTTRGNDLALAARAQGVRPEDIRQVICRISLLTQNCLRYVIPQNGMEAKFSLEYCLAKSLIDGPVQIRDFEDDYVRQQVFSEPMASLLPKISRSIPDDLGKGVPFASEYMEQVYLLNNGVELCLRSEAPKGFPQNPLKDAELESKFLGCLDGYGTLSEQKQLYRRLLQVDREEDFAALVDGILRLMAARASSSDDFGGKINA